MQSKKTPCNKSLKLRLDMLPGVGSLPFIRKSQGSLLCVLSIFVLFSVYQVSEAGIKCWVCNSFNDLGCGDPFDNSSFPITDCDAEYNKRENLKGVKATMCRKSMQKIQGKWRYIRSCAFLGEPGIAGDERFCRRYMGSFDLYTEDCLCRSKDGCNAAPPTFGNNNGVTELIIAVVSVTFLVSVAATNI